MYLDFYLIYYFLVLLVLELKCYVYVKCYFEKLFFFVDLLDKEELLMYLDYVFWLFNVIKDNFDVFNRKFENIDNIQLLELVFNINENRCELVEVEKFFGKI